MKITNSGLILAAILVSTVTYAGLTQAAPLAGLSQPGTLGNEQVSGRMNGVIVKAHTTSKGMSKKSHHHSHHMHHHHMHHHHMHHHVHHHHMHHDM